MENYVQLTMQLHNCTTIFHNKEYFMSSTLIEAKLNIISSLVDMIEGSRRLMFILVNGTKLYNCDTLYLPKFKRKSFELQGYSS